MARLLHDVLYSIAESYTLEDLRAITSAGWPVALANLSTYAFSILDLVVIGHVLGPDSLAAACLCLVVVNLALESSCFIMHNAMTSLCAYAFAAQNSALLFWHVRAGTLFSVVLSLPIAALVLATPSLLAEQFALPEYVVAGVRAYAPSLAFVVTPSLLLSALQGLLRARGQQRSTALLSWLALLPNALFASQLVPAYGLRGSAYATAATRVVCLLLLGIRHRTALLQPAAHARSIAGGGSSGSGSGGGGLRAPLLYIGKDYAHSLLPVTLRIGVAQLVTLIAVVPSVSAAGAHACIQAACFALTSLLLQAALSVCMGVQQATMMLVTRHVSLGRHQQARDAMRLAGVLLLTLSALFGAPYYAARQHLGSLLIGSYADGASAADGGEGERDDAGADLAIGVRALAAYVAPVLLLKTASGLYGLFFAVTGRGAIGTCILLLAHGCVGLPVAWVWASAQGGSAEALMQAHTAAWLLATVAFGGCYVCLPTSVPPPSAPPPDPEAASPRSSGGGGAAVPSPLARPLLDRGRPAA